MPKTGSEDNQSKAAPMTHSASNDINRLSGAMFKKIRISIRAASKKANISEIKRAIHT